MKAVIQRVKSAECIVDGAVTGACREGLLILLGVGTGDSEEDADLLVKKIAKLRIFCDENDKMNLSCEDIGGEMLIISNFTLYADYSHGNRPNYLNAEAPERANELYEYFCEQMSKYIVHIGRGVFGAHMELTPILNGPVTIVMESQMMKKKKG